MGLTPPIFSGVQALAFALGVIMTEFAALDAEGICPTPQCIPSPIRRHQSVVYCFAVLAIPVELTVLTHVSDAIIRQMLRPFRCNELRTATLISEYPIHGTLPTFRSCWLVTWYAPRCDRRHTKGAQVIHVYCNFKTKRAAALNSAYARPLFPALVCRGIVHLCLFRG